MGCEYSFKALCSSAIAVMVTNKDIKAARCPAGEDVKEETHTSSDEKDEDEEEDHDESGEEDESEEDDEDENEDRLDDPLDKDDVEWLLDRAPGYNAYEIGESFVLFTKRHNDIRNAPSFRVQGPGEIDYDQRVVHFNIEEVPKGEAYTELLELACKFTPSGSKLSFAPGMYSFAAAE